MTEGTALSIISDVSECEMIRTDNEPLGLCNCSVCIYYHSDDEYKEALETREKYRREKYKS